MEENGIPMEGMGDGKIRVLVVDDDPEIIELFLDVLQSDGRFDVATAQTGYDAGLLTQKFRPDIVVLDYLLPDINGDQVCRTIRQDPELSKTKILAISGMTNPAEIEAIKAAGANDFIKKPFNIENFIDRMIELVRRR